MQIDDFRQLPHRVKTNLLEVERDFSLLSVSRQPSKLLIKASNYRAPRKIETMQHSTWQHKLRCLSAYVELPYDYRDVLATVNIPTTLLIGGRSKIYDPNWQRQLADMLPNAKVEMITNAGHAIPMDAPIEFYRILKAFLSDKK
jgi:pimeloyl-ACP methyl ester carboxylesterase